MMSVQFSPRSNRAASIANAGELTGNRYGSALTPPPAPDKLPVLAAPLAPLPFAAGPAGRDRAPGRARVLITFAASRCSATNRALFVVPDFPLPTPALFGADTPVIADADTFAGRFNELFAELFGWLLTSIFAPRFAAPAPGPLAPRFAAPAPAPLPPRFTAPAPAPLPPRFGFTPPAPTAAFAGPGRFPLDPARRALALREPVDGVADDFLLLLLAMVAFV